MVVVVVVLGVTVVKVMAALQGQGEGVVSNMAVLKAGVECWMGKGVHIPFTGGNSERLQHVKDNLTLCETRTAQSGKINVL